MMRSQRLCGAKQARSGGANGLQHVLLAVGSGTPIPYPFGCWGLARLAGDLHLGDLNQVLGEDRPADPTAQPRFSVIEAAVQPKVPSQHMDPSFDPSAEPEPAPEPRFLLLRPPLGGRFAVVGHHDAADARCFRQLLIGERMDPSVARQEVWGFSKAFPV